MYHPHFKDKVNERLLRVSKLVSDRTKFRLLSDQNLRSSPL